MPKYTCKRCGTECYGCILYALKTCHSCGALIHRHEVQEGCIMPSEASPAAAPSFSEKAGQKKLLLFER